jgi:hypothetical protein
MMTLLKEKVIDLDLFDERSIHEVTDPNGTKFSRAVI